MLRYSFFCLNIYTYTHTISFDKTHQLQISRRTSTRPLWSVSHKTSFPPSLLTSQVIDNLPCYLLSLYFLFDDSTQRPRFRTRERSQSTGTPESFVRTDYVWSVSFVVHVSRSTFSLVPLFVLSQT